MYIMWRDAWHTIDTIFFGVSGIKHVALWSSRHHQAARQVNTGCAKLSFFEIYFLDNVSRQLFFPLFISCEASYFKRKMYINPWRVMTLDALTQLRPPQGLSSRVFHMKWVTSFSVVVRLQWLTEWHHSLYGEWALAETNKGAGLATAGRSINEQTTILW